MGDRPISEVQLVPKAEDALMALELSTGCTATDIINRALQLYSTIEGQLDESAKARGKKGGRVMIRRADPPNKNDYVVSVWS